LIAKEELFIMDTSAAQSYRTESRINRIRAWIINHDDSWLFITLYIGLAVVLSIWISLFWLVVVVAVHFAFEIIRQRENYTNWRAVVSESLWELKLDIALVLFALAVSLYMELALGVVGLRGAARIASTAQAGLRGSARFAAWQKLIRGLLLSVDDAAQVARVVAGKNNTRIANAMEVKPPLQKTLLSRNRWIGPWAHGDWIAIGMGIVCFSLLVAAPFLTEHTFSSAIAALAAELHPFP
jgi:hypothetical protein